MLQLINYSGDGGYRGILRLSDGKGRYDMQYIALIHGNREANIHSSEWTRFIENAQASGMFKGGSELGQRYPIGATDVPDPTNVIDGFMRFDSNDLSQLMALLESHPCIIHGGTIELREMPRSQ